METNSNKGRFSRSRIWEVVEVAKDDDPQSRWFDICILSLIFLNVGAVIIGTVQVVSERFGQLLQVFEVFSVIVFSIEYVLRIWSCTADESYRQPIRGRLKFMIRPLALIDLFAILPFYLPFIGLDLRFVRILRLLRILRLAKLARYSKSLQTLGRVFLKKKEELVLTSVMMLFLFVGTSCVMYYCEHQAQPENFPDIPTSMWWSVVTLTTVGYGDIYPVTTLGRLFGAVIAIVGIGMVALPTGILGSAFVEEIQRTDESRKSGKFCPHCGGVLQGEGETVSES